MSGRHGPVSGGGCSADGYLPGSFSSRHGPIGSGDGGGGGDDARFPSGAFTISNPASGRVLDLGPDGTLQIWHCNSRPNQLWWHDAATRAIVNQKTGQALEIDRDGMTLSACNPTGAPNQQWVFDGRTVVNPSTGKVLDVDADPLARGRCIVWDWRNTANQWWELRAVATVPATQLEPAALARATHSGASPTPQAAHQTKATHLGGHPAPSSRSAAKVHNASQHMTLRDDDGTEVRLIANSAPIELPNFNGHQLILREPIFFCPRARLAAKQRRAQPVLFLTQYDWQQLKRPAITHEGAFGSDDALFSAAKIADRFNPDLAKSSYDPRAVGLCRAEAPQPGEVWICHTNGKRAFYRRPRDDASLTLKSPPAGSSIHQREETGVDAGWFERRWSHLVANMPSGPSSFSASDWVVVWKFPGDLNRVPTFRRIEGIPLPVGCYPLLDDGWWVPSPPPPRLPTLPLNECSVEKMRTDLTNGGHVHHLEKPGDGSAQVAAITSTYFIEGFWNMQPATLPQIVTMLRELYDLGLYAFPCYGQHHVIVLYADLTAEPITVLSPQGFCERILASEQRRSRVLAALQRGAFPGTRDTLVLWSRNYMRAYHHQG